MKIYGRVEVWPHTFLILVLNTDASAALTPQNEPQLDEPLQWQRERFLPLPTFAICLSSQQAVTVLNYVIQQHRYSIYKNENSNIFLCVYRMYI
jgi:hypothetical protein